MFDSFYGEFNGLNIQSNQNSHKKDQINKNETNVKLNSSFESDYDSVFESLDFLKKSIEMLELRKSLKEGVNYSQRSDKFRGSIFEDLYKLNDSFLEEGKLRKSRDEIFIDFDKRKVVEEIEKIKKNFEFFRARREEDVKIIQDLEKDKQTLREKIHFLVLKIDEIEDLDIEMKDFFDEIEDLIDNNNTDQETEIFSDIQISEEFSFKKNEQQSQRKKLKIFPFEKKQDNHQNESDFTKIRFENFRVSLGDFKSKKFRKEKSIEVKKKKLNFYSTRRSEMTTPLQTIKNFKKEQTSTEKTKKIFVGKKGQLRMKIRPKKKRNRMEGNSDKENNWNFFKTQEKKFLKNKLKEERSRTFDRSCMYEGSDDSLMPKFKLVSQKYFLRKI